MAKQCNWAGGPEDFIRPIKTHEGSKGDQDGSNGEATRADVQRERIEAGTAAVAFVAVAMAARRAGMVVVCTGTFVGFVHRDPIRAERHGDEPNGDGRQKEAGSATFSA